jgi:hypothetical protein
LLPTFGRGFLVVVSEHRADRRIDTMDLLAQGTANELVGVGIFRHVFGCERLGQLSGLRAAEGKKWHGETGLRWSRGSDPRLLRLTMDGYLTL